MIFLTLDRDRLSKHYSFRFLLHPYFLKVHQNGIGLNDAGFIKVRKVTLMQSTSDICYVQVLVL